VLKAVDQMQVNRIQQSINRCGRYFVSSTSAILLMTAALKLYGATTGASTDAAAAYFDRADRVAWFLSTRQLLVLTALLEIVVAMAISWRRTRLDESLPLIAWISSVFLAYRLARWRLGAAGAPCGCLGLLAWPGTELLSKLALAWMLCGSLILIGLQLFGRRRWKQLSPEGLSGERNES
jgi:hypothetical protein